MSNSLFVDVETVASLVDDGDVVALPFEFSADFSAAAMDVTRSLIVRGVRQLHLLGVPSLSLQADMLIGAGCVSVVESGSILLYEYGRANRFVTAQASGAIRVKDSTCPAIHASLVAGEKGLPFLPVRGLIGSDILRYRIAQDGWRVIDNPFGENDPIVLIPALRPDVALFHVPLADRHGNLWVGRRSELMTLAKSALRVLVTFEAIYDGYLPDNEQLAPAVIPGMLVTAVAHRPGGSWPLDCGATQPQDAAHMREYARLAESDEGFREYLERYVFASARAG
jgi:glutaconate CoA-transferase subunit A